MLLHRQFLSFPRRLNLDPHLPHKFHRIDFSGVAQSVFLPRIIKELKKRGLKASQIGKHLLEGRLLSTTMTYERQQNSVGFTAKKGSWKWCGKHTRTNKQEGGMNTEKKMLVIFHVIFFTQCHSAVRLVAKRDLVKER